MGIMKTPSTIKEHYVLNLISTVASSSSESPIAVIAFVIGCTWFYIHTSKKDNEHEVKMKQLDNEKKK